MGQVSELATGEGASDESLVASLGAGRQEALGSLYQRYAALLFAVAAQSLDRSVAEEIVQDVFLEVWRRARRFDPAQGPFRPWLLQLVHWRILNELRRRRRRPTTEADTDDAWLEALPDDSPSPADRAWEAERRATLRAALESLPDAQRQAVHLAYFDDLTHAQVAQQLRVPLGTAKTRIRSGLLRMRTTLAPVAAALGVALLVGGLGLAWARTQEALRRDERALTLVTASDVVPRRLTATGGISAATHANYRGRVGTDVAVLTVSNLSPAPAGQVYRAWVLSGERWIALGTITPDADGSARLIAEDADLALPADRIEIRLEQPTTTGQPTGRVIVAWSADASAP